MTAATRTDLWSVDKPADPNRSWWAEKAGALHALPAERAHMGCDCDSPPWVSPPHEWPLKVLLHHSPDCGSHTLASNGVTRDRTTG